MESNLEVPFRKWDLRIPSLEIAIWQDETFLEHHGRLNH